MAQKTVKLTVFVVLVLLLEACGISTEAKLRKALATQSTGLIQLPAGVIEVSSELKLAPGAHDLEIAGAGTLLKASNNFKGRAILVAEDVRSIRLHDFSIDGNRPMLEKPLDMAPPENAFRVYYSNNGILLNKVISADLSNLQIDAVAGFAILASQTTGVKIRNIQVQDSGSLSTKGKNNTTGGIVLEEGSNEFEVRDCKFRRIRGNALWTHSLFMSPRLEDGVFAGNRFDNIGRDAIQVGHATRVRVEENTGSRIGFPFEEVDPYGPPVAIDTAGNVDRTTYTHNKFEEIDGKCMDLDGFHDGSIVENSCVNRLTPESYPYGHFGIVLNNTFPGMRSENIEIRGNIIDGTKFGGLFLIGRGHQVIDNRFDHLNKAECNENAKQFGCVYKTDEPQMLESGIYLGRGGSRAEETRNNVIRDNKISGHKMKSRCIEAAPGVSLKLNIIKDNTCADFSLERK